MPTPATLIVCHGHALEPVTPATWEQVVVGDRETGQRGRLLTALALMRQMSVTSRPAQLFLGTGARNDTIAETNVDRRKQLRATDALDYRNKLENALRMWATGVLGENVDTSLQLLEAATLDTSSMTTVEELQQAKAESERMNAGSVVLVSTPEHILRCHAMALDVFRNTRSTVSAIAAQTRFQPSGALSTVILEGVHGVHDPDYVLPEDLRRHTLARAMFFGPGRSEVIYRRRLADLARASS